jgi:hypothetical protein
MYTVLKGRRMSCESVLRLGKRMAVLDVILYYCNRTTHAAANANAAQPSQLQQGFTVMGASQQAPRCRRILILGKSGQQHEAFGLLGGQRYIEDAT